MENRHQREWEKGQVKFNEGGKSLERSQVKGTGPGKIHSWLGVGRGHFLRVVHI